MTFWLIASAMIALTTLSLLIPLLRARQRAEFAGREHSVYVDQLKEIDRDEAIGLITPANAEAARIEIKRRMIRAPRGADTREGGGGGKWLILVAALAVPAIGGGIYYRLGHPDLPSLRFADREEERTRAQELQVLIARLRERLLSDSELRQEGWVMLARTYMETGQPEEAAWAISTLIQRGGDAIGPEIYAYYAEILIRVDDGIVSPKAEAALDMALKMQPDNVAAIYYKAMAYEQSGELEKAYTMLKERVEQEAVYVPWMDPVAGRANALASRIGAEPVSVPQAAPGPSAGDVAAAGQMSEEERQAFIRSMVDRLATRLAEQPDDLDGWLKLGNAYRVLGETEKSVEAYRKAEGLAADLAQDDPRRRIIEKALSEQGG